jgi:lipopolysaccharide export LptBFGC system permease protein LptF
MKKDISVGAYFARAKAFGYLMVISAVAYFLFWLFSSVTIAQ